MYNSKKQTKVNAKQKKKVKESYTFKKHQCSSYLTRTARKQIDEMKETTHHPMLYPNKITEKINKARKLEPYSGKVSSKRYSIYEHLYAETARRQMKKQIKNEMK